MPRIYRDTLRLILQNSSASSVSGLESYRVYLCFEGSTETAAANLLFFSGVTTVTLNVQDHQSTLQSHVQVLKAL